MPTLSSRGIRSSEVAIGFGTVDVTHRIEELRFVVVGAYVADCFVSVSRLPVWDEEYEARSIRTTPGGKALNQAVALARLGTQGVCKVGP